MIRCTFLLVAVLLASPAVGQIAYDAGLPGDPPVAPSPTSFGWTETVTGSCSVTDISPDPDFPYNAWQLTDSGTGLIRYEKEWPVGGDTYAAELVMRMLAGTIFLRLDGGDTIVTNLFELELFQSGQDLHVREMNSGNTLVCPGGANDYHHIRFVSGYGWDIGRLYFDGAYIGDLPYTSWGSGPFGCWLTWGTLDGSPGRARFHRVWFGTNRPVTSYCFGDGSGTPCPCSNPGLNGEGCANSSGAGAWLFSEGSVSALADDLVFESWSLLPGQPALLFSGLNRVNLGSGLPFGDGLRCAGGGVVRLGVEVPDPQWGSARWGPGLGATGAWGPGDVRRFQVWYRDPTGSPCGSGFNLSNGYEVTFTN